jgi:hypothetical protein
VCLLDEKLSYTASGSNWIRSLVLGNWRGHDQGAPWREGQRQCSSPQPRRVSGKAAITPHASSRETNRPSSRFRPDQYLSNHCFSCQERPLRCSERMHSTLGILAHFLSMSVECCGRYCFKLGGSGMALTNGLYQLLFPCYVDGPPFRSSTGSLYHR